MNTDLSPTASIAPDQDHTLTTGSNEGPIIPQKLFDNKLESNSIRVLKTAFRKWKRSRKKGAALIEVRRTRHGRPVY